MAIVNEEKYGNNSANTLVNDKKGYTYMSGLKGNDTYVIENISKSFTEIDDSDGLDESLYPENTNQNGIPLDDYGKDTIQIKNVKANDLALFFDVSLSSNNPEFAAFDDLYIVKKSAINSVFKQVVKRYEAEEIMYEENPYLSDEEINEAVMAKFAPQSGAVYIPCHFGDTNNGGTQYSASAIEKIQVVDGKTGVTKTLDIKEYITEVKEEVVEFLREIKPLGLRDNYGDLIVSASQLLNSKHTKYKNKLFNLYKSEEFDITIEGTRGNDKLVGENGDNTFLFKEGSGHDTITSSKGDDDTLKFEGINEVEYRNNKNDLIIYYGSDNSVTIKNYLKNPLKSPIEYIELGNSGKTRLYDEIEIDVYGTGKKSVAGTKLEDNIYGTDVAETIKASDGDDDITANGGDDKLYGGSGENDFYFSAGDGNDVVYYDKNAQDTLNFVDVSLSDLHIEKGKYNGIKIVTTNGNSVELANYLKKGQTSVAEIYTGGDDTTTTLQNFLQGKYLIQNGNEKNNKLTGTSIADEIYGGAGNDTIKAAAGDDILVGGAGDDKLYGGAGRNEYQISAGDGNDVVYYDKNASNDVLNFTDARMNELHIEKGKYNGIKIVNQNGDSFELASYLKNGKTSVAEIHTGKDGQTQSLADFLEGKRIYQYGDVKNNKLTGTSIADEIYGGAGNDTIKAAAGDDILVGGAGDDKLYGGAGRNEYQISAGDGNDVVYYDKKANDDTLSFYGIEQGDLHIEKGKYNGIRIVSEDGNSFELANYLKNGLTSVANIHTEIDDETIALKDFLNGKRIYQYGDVKNNKLTGTSIADEIYGGDGKDTLQGKAGNDYLYGEAHDDTIKGGDGNDHLSGGVGNDKLYGEAGHNTFYFSDGDGKDTIYMGKGVDKIVFDDSVTEYNDDPVFIRNKNNLEIRYGLFDDNGERNSVTVSNYFKSKYQSVQTVQINGEDYNLKDIVIEGKVNNFLYAVPVKEYVAKDDIVENNNLMYIDGKNNLAYGGYGDDMYHVSSLKNNTYIEDESGYDRLIINEKSSNINVLFDVYSDGSVPTSGDYSSIIIMNDSNMKKLMKYGDLTDVTSGIEISRGESGIEEIYSKDGKMINVEQLQNSVASWLSSNGYDSAIQVVEYQNQDDIQALLGIYQNAWEPVV